MMDPLPKAAGGPIAPVTDALLARHGQDLVGTDRHGSLVTGGWEPGRSDADLLIVRRSPLGDVGRGSQAGLRLRLFSPLRPHKGPRSTNPSRQT
jgi:hypothetical protein